MNHPITYSTTFLRHWKDRISPQEDLVEDYIRSVEAFKANPKLVDDHELQEPMHDRRAFWMNNDYRVIYRVKGDDILFVDIGTHEQVYQR